MSLREILKFPEASRIVLAVGAVYIL